MTLLAFLLQLLIAVTSVASEVGDQGGLMPQQI